MTDVVVDGLIALAMVGCCAFIAVGAAGLAKDLDEDAAERRAAAVRTVRELCGPQEARAFDRTASPRGAVALEQAHRWVRERCR
jgi:hypothetical protein